MSEKRKVKKESILNWVKQGKTRQGELRTGERAAQVRHDTVVGPFRPSSEMHLCPKRLSRTCHMGIFMSLVCCAVST